MAMAAKLRVIFDLTIIIIIFAFIFFFVHSIIWINFLISQNFCCLLCSLIHSLVVWSLIGQAQGFFHITRQNYNFHASSSYLFVLTFLRWENPQIKTGTDNKFLSKLWVSHVFDLYFLCGEVRFCLKIQVHWN